MRPKIYAALLTHIMTWLAIATPPTLAYANQPPIGDPVQGREAAKRVRILLIDAEEFFELDDKEKFCQAHAMIGNDINVNILNLQAAEPNSDWMGLAAKSKRIFARCFMR